MSKRVKFGKLLEKDVLPAIKLTLDLTKEAHARIEEVVAHASEHVMPHEMVKMEYDLEQLTGVLTVPPPPFVAEIPEGFVCVYRHETTQNGTVMRRLGIACPGEFPPHAAVGVIMRLFGFVNPIPNVK